MTRARRYGVTPLGELQQTNTAHGHLGGAHPPVGRLAPEVIQRIVRASFSSVKTCYEKGLTKDKALTGRVATRFVISESGDVSGARPDVTTNLSSPEVVACIVAVFKSLKFPQPEGGIVTVVYPLNFSPGD